MSHELTFQARSKMLILGSFLKSTHLLRMPDSKVKLTNPEFFRGVKSLYVKPGLYGSTL